MTRYSTGRNFEWRIRDILTEHGAAVVRSAGSKGKADLVAMWPEYTYAIQCKNHKPTAADRNDVITESGKTDARWALVWVEGLKIKCECFRKGKPWKVFPPGLGKVA